MFNGCELRAERIIVRKIRVNTCYFKIPAFQLTSVNKRQVDIMILVKDQGHARKVRVFSTLNEKKHQSCIFRRITDNNDLRTAAYILLFELSFGAHTYVILLFT